VVIDRVLAVSALSGSRIEPGPDICTPWQGDFVQGVVREPDGFVVILDVGRIFGSEDSVPARAEH